ncbi:MAG: transporter substrate-binding protein [Caldilineaceae bacterium]
MDPGGQFSVGAGIDQRAVDRLGFAYSRVAHTIIKVQLNQAGYNVVGELFVPLGGTDFGAFIQQLRASPPDVIVNTMCSESNVAFFQQLAEAGITAQDIPVLSTSVAEEEVRVIGPEYVRGHYTTLNYFQTLATPENFTFVTAYKNAYGNERVTSAPIAAAYSGVYVWKALVETAGTPQPTPCVPQQPRPSTMSLRKVR